jgi:CubicO group peptidase (beta-lactamase class C family)
VLVAYVVAGPVVADFPIARPPGCAGGLALSVPPPGRDDSYSSAESAPGAPGSGVRISDGNSVAWRRAEIPAGNGIGNARSVALVQSVLACEGTLRGRRFLSPLGCARARQEQFSGVDRRLGMQIRWGLGYGLFGTSIGWGGWGGSLVMVEPDRRLAVAYVTNQVGVPQDDSRGLEVVMAAYDGFSVGSSRSE